jgi:hypothetical protein
MHTWEQTIMKLYRANYHANYQTHFVDQWALSAYDVERSILAKAPKATGIYVWVL